MKISTFKSLQQRLIDFAISPEFKSLSDFCNYHGFSDGFILNLLDVYSGNLSYYKSLFNRFIDFLRIHEGLHCSPIPRDYGKYEYSFGILLSGEYKLTDSNLHSLIYTWFLAKYDRYILTTIPVDANENSIVAFLSFVWNVGHAPEGLTLDNWTLFPVLSRKYNKVHGVECPGLVNRRQAEADLFYSTTDDIHDFIPF